METEVLVQKLIGTAAVVGGALLLRYGGRRFVASKEEEPEEVRLRWHLRLGQAVVALVLIGLVLIWAPELHSMALSAVAIAAAIVIGGKELIMCLLGGVLRAVSSSFTVGDRIEVDGLRGDVIRYGFLTTTLLEIGPAHQQTGRVLTVPNSAFLSHPVVNETFTHDYVLHTFAVQLKAGDDWEGAERALLEAATKVSADYRAAASERMTQVSKRFGLAPPPVEPRVSLQIPEAGKLTLLVRVATPARKKGRVERAILRMFLESPAGKNLKS